MNKLEWCKNPLLADPANEFLSIQVATNGRFNSGSNITGDNYSISFAWPGIPGTSYTTIRIDGTNYVYGTDGIQITPPTDINPLLNKSAWQIGDILIEQYLEIVNNPYTNRMDMGQYYYKITNTSESSQHTVGIRVMIDIMVNSDDGPAIIIPGMGILNKETEFTNIPYYWQATSNNNINLSKTALGILTMGGESIPSKVTFAAWGSLSSNQWDYTPNPNVNVSTVDNAVAIYWNEQTLDANQSMTKVTRYGLSPETNIPFRDSVSLTTKTVQCTGDLFKNIEVAAEIKVFANKYAHSEADCIEGAKPGKGDDLGFTLVFGNYGEMNYTASSLEATVEDTLVVQSPINLKLMSLCDCEDFILFNLNTNSEVKICDIFYGGTIYKLQVRKLRDGGNPDNIDDYIASFDIPCHSIYCISMLFQIEFEPCIKCQTRP